MKNFEANGEVMTVTAASAVVSGQGLLVGSIFGVAAADAGTGEQVAVNLTGVYELPKAPSQAWSQGATIYWDAENSRCTTTASGNTRIGVAWAAVAGGAGDVIGHVRLNGAAT